MKKIVFFMIFFGLFASARSQTITHARFMLSKNAGSFKLIELELNGKYVIGMTGDGEIRYIEEVDGSKLLEFECNGLGFPIKYYDRFDIHDIPGRVKSIGNIQIAYNNVFDIHEIAGTIKSVGDISIKYYNVFDAASPRGRVKSVGNVTIDYHDLFFHSRVSSVMDNGAVLSVSRYYEGDFSERPFRKSSRFDDLD